MLGFFFQEVYTVFCLRHVVSQLSPDKLYFRYLLIRVRRGDVTKDDYNYLKTRMIKCLLDNSISLFSLNSEAEIYNNNILRRMSNPIFFGGNQ